MKDLIEIKIEKALFFAFHGVNEDEKEHGQTFIVDIVYYIQPKDFNDDILKTVDYSEVVVKAEKFFLNKRYNLIEQIARDMSFHLLAEFKDINKISISVKKSSPPVGATVKSVTASYTASQGL